MRPPEFTGGNPVAATSTHNRLTCFNEAAGIHRRKRVVRRASTAPSERFNEAAGIHRRKRANQLCGVGAGFGASMRPPEFTGGNPMCVAGPSAAQGLQ